MPERGEGRNHDLLLEGVLHHHLAIVSVEAKADESFDLPIGDYIRRAEAKNSRTRTGHRARALLHLLAGPDADPLADPWSTIRYQLLTGAAGAVIEAANRHAAVAVFVVHEFRTPALYPERLSQNHRDFAAFVSLIIGQPTDIVPGQLYGPVALTSGPHLPFPVGLLLGKAQRSSEILVHGLAGRAPLSLHDESDN